MLARFLLFKPTDNSAFGRLASHNKKIHTLLSRLMEQHYLTCKEVNKIAKEIYLRMDIDKHPKRKQLLDAIPYILSGQMKFAVAKQLAEVDDYGITLNIPYLVASKCFTVDEALALTQEDRMKIFLVHQFLYKNLLTWSQFKSLSKKQLEIVFKINQSHSPLLELIIKKQISLDKILNMSLSEVVELDKLSSQVKDNSLLMREALELAKKSAAGLCRETKEVKEEKEILNQFKALIDSNHVDPKKLFEYQAEERAKILQAQSLIVADRISVEEAIKLTKIQINELSNLRWLIQSPLSIDEVLRLPRSKKEMLSNVPAAQGLVAGRILSLEELDRYSIDELASIDLCKTFIRGNVLTIEQASKIPVVNAMRLLDLEPFILTKALFIQEALQCNYEEVSMLSAAAGKLVNQRYEERMRGECMLQITKFPKELADIVVGYAAPGYGAGYHYS